MTRASFGGGVADFVVSAATPGDPLRFAAATLTMWSAETGGTQHTDLLLNGNAVTSIPVGADGQVPTFQGPDEVLVMWAQAGAGAGGRVLLDASGDIALRAGAAVEQAEIARDDAVAAKEAAEAVGATADAQMTAIASNPATAFAQQQSASIAEQVAGVGALAPEPTGSDDTAALKALISLSKKFSLRPGKTYVISERLAFSTGQVFDAQGATLKRAAQKSSAVSTATTSGSTTTVTVADGTQFRVGQQVTLATASAFDATPRTISAIAGNNITVSSAFGLATTADTATLHVTHSLVVAPGGCVIRDLNIDGNRANVPFARWQNTTEVTLSGDGNLVEGGRWAECPGEGMVWFGNHSRVRDVRMENVNGNGVHFSGTVDSIASRLWIKSANLDTNVGHADGAFSLSNEVYDTVVSECYLDTAISGVGGYDSADNARLKVLGCTIKNMTLTALDGRLPNGVGVDDLTFEGNTVIDCAEAHFGSTGAATTVRGTRWKINGNTFLNTPVVLNRLQSSEFLRNTVERDTSGGAVQVNGLIGCKVDDNTVIGGNYGFYFAGETATRDVSIGRNMLRGQSLTAIHSSNVADSTGVNITGNTIVGDAAAASTWKGILPGSKHDVYNNTVTGPTGAAHSCIYAQNGALVRFNTCRKGGATYTIRADGGTTGIQFISNLVDAAISNSGGAGNTETGTTIIA